MSHESWNTHTVYSMRKVLPAAVAILPWVGLTNVGQSFAQSPASPTLTFEVASIKPCTLGPLVAKDGGPGGGGGRPSPTPGMYRSACDTVIDLIRTAYGEFVPISGGPGWINSDRYQITAKAEGDASSATMRGPMLRQLLGERFNLKIRSEIKEVPVYTLTLAKGGFKLQPLKQGTCMPIGDLADLEAGQKPCGFPMTGMRESTMTTEILGSFRDFCKVMGATLGRPVIDRTGIAGTFDFHLDFAVDESIGGISHSSAAPSNDSTGPSIFTAVQEQLGLKFESAKGPGESLVIAHIERPSRN
jgi:uncharacterized protein (TIGR03435 family)